LFLQLTEDVNIPEGYCEGQRGEEEDDVNIPKEADAMYKRWIFQKKQPKELVECD
jgi:hypothetical protein